MSITPRRGDALLWRGLRPRRVQTAFTNGTQGGKVHLNGSILFRAAAGCCLGVFGRIFFARRKVESKTRCERVGFNWFFSSFLKQIHGVKPPVLSSRDI